MSEYPISDLHIHTTYSDGRNSLADTVLCGEAFGLESMAIADHYFEGENSWFDDYLQETARYKGVLGKTMLYVGVEGVILDEEGNISVPQDIAEKLDFVIVDLGQRSQLFAGSAQDIMEKVCKAYRAVCQIPYVQGIAHPFNVGRLSDNRLRVRDFAKDQLSLVARDMAVHGVSFEIMNQMVWWFPQVNPTEFTAEYVELVKLFAREGVKFTLGSDAHSSGSVGNLLWAHEVCRQARIEPGQVLTRMAK